MLLAMDFRFNPKGQTLYKEVEEYNRKELIDQYGSYVESLTRYEGKKTDYYFIRWMQSVTEIVDGVYIQSMRYFADTITVNGKEIIDNNERA